MATNPANIDRQSGVSYSDTLSRDRFERTYGLTLEEAYRLRQSGDLNPQAAAGLQPFITAGIVGGGSTSGGKASAKGSGAKSQTKSTSSADKAMLNSASASGSTSTTSSKTGSTSGSTGGSTGGGGGGSRSSGGGSNTSVPSTGYDEQYAISKGQSWNGIPPDGEVWKVDGTYAVAYRVGNTGPYLYYTIKDKADLNRIFPGGVPKDVRELTKAEANRMGAITPGSHNLLANNLGENWEEGFASTIEKEALTSPWLKDPEVAAVVLAATLEGRAVTRADLEGTEYFASRSDAEIDYVAFSATATPSELKQYGLQYEDSVRQQLIEAGVRSPDKTLVSFIANKWASGQWSEGYAARNIIALANPFSTIEMDSELKKMTSGMELDTLKGRASEVELLVQEWLGPNHGASYSEEWYRQWAGAIADDPNAQNDLVDYLQGQRMALYPEYTNANLRYADIAPVWENQMQQAWGRTAQSAKEYAVLDKVIRTNDVAEAGKVLRGEGVNLGVEQVSRDIVRNASQALGDAAFTAGG